MEVVQLERFIIGVGGRGINIFLKASKMLTSPYTMPDVKILFSLRKLDYQTKVVLRSYIFFCRTASLLLTCLQELKKTLATEECVQYYDKNYQSWNSNTLVSC